MVIEDDKSFVAFLDIYGFSALVNTSVNTENVIKGLEKYSEAVCKFLSDRGNEYLLFSDSIFIRQAAPLSEFTKELDKMIHTVSHVQNIAANHGFALRGSIAYGKGIFRRNFVIGDAVIRAHNNERLLRQPLVILPFCEIPDGQPRVGHYKYIETRDGGLIYGLPIYPEPIDGYIKLVEEKLGMCLRRGESNFARTWHDTLKLINEKDDGKNGN